MRIVFFGTQDWAAKYLEALLSEPFFEVVCVVTQPDEVVGRKKTLTATPVKLVALEHGLSVLQPIKLKDAAFQNLLRETGAEMGIVIAYGRILPESVITSMRLGCINVHPSLLPKWRGPSPVQAAIAAGDTNTGITIMRIDAQMDHGPVLAQITLPLASDETLASFMPKVVDTGVPVFLKALQDYATGKLVPTEQDHAQATVCKLLTRADGILDWSESAEALERKIRAYNPWPGTSTGDLKIFSVGFSERKLPAGEQLIDNSKLFMGTGTTALEILELQPAGRKRMSTADYLRGLHA